MNVQSVLISTILFSAILIFAIAQSTHAQTPLDVLSEQLGFENKTDTDTTTNVTTDIEEITQQSVLGIIRQSNVSGGIEPMSETEMTVFVESPASQLEYVRQQNASGEMGPMNATELVLLAYFRQQLENENVENQAIRDQVLNNATQMGNYAQLIEDFGLACLDFWEEVPWNMNATKKCGNVFSDYNREIEKILLEHRTTFDEVLYGITQ